MSSQGRIQQFEKGRGGGGGGVPCVTAPIGRGSGWWLPWPPEALGLKMLPGVLCTDSLLTLQQFYVQFQGQIQEYLGGGSFPTWGRGVQGKF